MNNNYVFIFTKDIHARSLISQEWPYNRGTSVIQASEYILRAIPTWSLSRSVGGEISNMLDISRRLSFAG